VALNSGGLSAVRDRLHLDFSTDGRQASVNSEVPIVAQEPAAAAGFLDLKTRSAAASAACGKGGEMGPANT
jgi:hypothetical protein